MSHFRLYLVDGTGDETMDVLVGSKYLWKGGAEGWGSLDGRKCHLADVVTVVEPKDTLGLVHCHTLLYL